VEKGKGDRIWDVDGNSYIDYCGSWGALILGHAPSPIVKAATKQMKLGSTFGITTAVEESLARRVVGHLPSMEKINFVLGCRRR
jgi:glutamate-1-semialdehyde 2,1-aminomutase